jgi:hypothetical protein
LGELEAGVVAFLDDAVDHVVIPVFLAGVPETVFVPGELLVQLLDLLCDRAGRALRLEARGQINGKGDDRDEQQNQGFHAGHPARATEGGKCEQWTGGGLKQMVVPSLARVQGPCGTVRWGGTRKRFTDTGLR